MRNKALLLLFTVLITACCLFSCEEPEVYTSHPETMTITDFPQFENLTRNPQKIIVTLSDPYYEPFELTSEEHINEIVDILFNNVTYELSSKTEFNITPTTLRFVDEEGNESASISTGAKKYEGKWYVPSYKSGSKTLDAIIYNLSRELGIVKNEPIDYFPILQSLNSFTYLNICKYPQKIVVKFNEPYNVTFDITDEEYISEINDILWDKTTYLLVDENAAFSLSEDFAEIYFIDEEGNTCDPIGATRLKYYKRYYTYIISSGEPTLHSTLLRIAKEMDKITE